MRIWITRDRIAESGDVGEDVGGNDAGRTLWGDEDATSGVRHTWSLWDDDGECYYEGVALIDDEDEPLELTGELWDVSLYSWGEWYAGTVSLKVDGVTIM
jgi:hypothetical protein